MGGVLSNQYGEVFTILLFGRKMTYFMTPDAADFFFNARHEDVSAELAYAPITVPVFGKDVVYDVPYAVLGEQKKYGWTRGKGQEGRRAGRGDEGMRAACAGSGAEGRRAGRGAEGMRAGRGAEGSRTFACAGSGHVAYTG